MNPIQKEFEACRRSGHDQSLSREVNMKHLLQCLLIITFATSLSARLARGQASECSYDQCALRLHRGSLVQGLEATRVARFRGWFSAPRIDLFETASDSARKHYQAFRTLYHQGAKLQTVGLALFIASGIVWLSDTHANHYYVPLGLAVASFPFRDIGYSRSRQSWDQLQQAIWFYNRDLARSP